MRVSNRCLYAALTVVFVASWNPPVTAAETAAKSKCATDAHRQFDFWIGTWRVTEKDKPAGENRIEAIDGGCALLESWRGVGGLTGHSLNTYDSTRSVWHQTWVDSSGSLLLLEGTFKNGAMVLEGAHVDPKRRERITWTQLPGGVVRQHWQTTSDGGATWATAFDGLYTRIDKQHTRD
jgi:hypothetical protein